MQLPIFFEKEFPSSGSFHLSGDSSRHVAQVLRMKENDLLQVTNGKGTILTAEIILSHKTRTEVKMIGKLEIPAARKKIIIAISPIKNTGRFEWFLEKATEVGISDIIPLLCKRTEKTHLREERMNTILTSAMLQSRQEWLPQLKPAITFTELIKSNDYPQRFIAHCVEEDKMNLNDIQFKIGEPAIILIGPEGDFTQGEIDFAIANNYTPVTLGETRLRTETAGLVAAVLLNNMK